MGDRTLLSLLVFTVFIVNVYSEDAFDVRQHLSSVTRYGAVKDGIENPVSHIPDKCTPIHLNLLARHGTRAPTKKKNKDFDALASRLSILLEDAKKKKSADKIPSWLRGWESPWKGKQTGGELIKEGEDELYNLALRTRERFPQLLNDEYHSDVYPIKATQVPRASASAVAFGMGLFSDKGNLGPGRHRAFAVSSESRASDTILRFHDCCQNYKAFRKSQEPAVHKLTEPVFEEITRAVVERYGLKFTVKDISSLWSLCKQEASVLGITDQACGLFIPSEVKLLEWTDDLESFILKGYGNSLNYRMGVPLLKDVIQSMEQAIQAKEEGYLSRYYEKARLRFAHAETLVPFSCLLGLFLDDSEFKLIQNEQPLQLPLKPPQHRNWRGANLVPFAGNNMLVLYSCPETNSSNYFVQVLHNEQPAPLAGCNGSDFCPFEVFKQQIAAPHLKHDYNDLCNFHTDDNNHHHEQKCLFTRISEMLSKIFSWRSADEHKDEL